MFKSKVNENRTYKVRVLKWNSKKSAQISWLHGKLKFNMELTQETKVGQDNEGYYIECSGRYLNETADSNFISYRNFKEKQAIGERMTKKESLCGREAPENPELVKQLVSDVSKAMPQVPTKARQEKEQNLKNDPPLTGHETRARKVHRASPPEKSSGRVTSEHIRELKVKHGLMKP